MQVGALEAGPGVEERLTSLGHTSLMYLSTFYQSFFLPMCRWEHWKLGQGWRSASPPWASTWQHCLWSQGEGEWDWEISVIVPYPNVMLAAP